MESVVEVKNLKKSYNGFAALKGVSFRINRGEVFTVVGPNGAGKTTILEIIEGIRKYNSGSVEILGQKEVNEYVKENIGVQLQEGRLMDNLTPYELATLFRSFYKKGYSPDEALKIVSLTDRKMTRVNNLSGGEKQRLHLALALINDPEIVFLDEPTTGIDPAARRELWDVILDFKRKNKTVILTTHSMDEAERLSDRVAILNRGEIIAMDSPLNLIQASQIENTITFSAGTVAKDALKAIERISDNLYVQEKQIKLFTSRLEEALAELFHIAKKQNFFLDNIYVKHPSLEDVFLLKTGEQYTEK